MANTSEQLLNLLEETAKSLQKTQINLKKCPKKRLTKGFIETKIKCIEDYWQLFKSTHIELVKNTPKERRSEISYFVNEDYYVVEDLYACMHSELKDMLSEIQTEVPYHEPASGESSQLQVKLPRIQLPMFSGKYEDWPTFHDLFTSLVHNNTTLSKVQKLQYLKSTITDEAEALLKYIQVTEVNYHEAWNILKNRYGNKRMIINSIFKKLFGQKRLYAQTSNQLKSLLDTTTDCLNNLRNLQLNIDSWDPIIIFLIVQKLDSESHKQWEEYAYKKNSDELPKWQELCSFLESKYRTLELVTSQNIKERTSKEKCFHSSALQSVRKCSMCHENHTLCHCKLFTKLQPAQRSEYVKSNRLCFNCLAPGHSVVRCKVTVACKICNKRHHSLLHQNLNTNIAGSTDSDSSKQPTVLAHCHAEERDEKEKNTNDIFVSHFSSKQNMVLLATALIVVKGSTGQTTVLRALVDPGSQASFISERAAQLLRLKRLPINGTVTGVGSTQTTVTYVVQLEVQSRYEENVNIRLKAYVLSTHLTTRLPGQTINKMNWPHLDGITLADPNYYKSENIDILLGVDVYSEIVKSNLLKGPPGTPCAQETSLGWILFGNIKNKNQDQSMVVMHHNLDLDDMLKTLWEIDTHRKKMQTQEEIKCENIYKNTVHRNEEGRYIVKLPFKKETIESPYGETKRIAIKRLEQLEKRLEKDKQLKDDYTKVINEYIHMNHMEEVPEHEIESKSVYLPHHAVIRNDKETTKLRIVFNASSKGTNDVSLNDELLVGPQLQDDLRSLVMRWRMKRICYTSDVEKMYRQILVAKEDTDYQRILWRNGKLDPIKVYRLLRVTFGTASAPYLAVKTLHQVAEDEGKNYPIASSIIKQDFFMDDLMSGADTVKEAIDNAMQVSTILRKGGFTLQKWSSNNIEFLKTFHPSERSSQMNVNIKLDGTIRALGLSWNVGEDTFHYDLMLPTFSYSLTKRNILAEIQRLYDPLGWLAPAFVMAKMLIQNLWIKRIGWDEEVDSENKNEWIKIRQSFEHLPKIKLNRWLYTLNSNITDVSIHGFCDASTKAYGAVAYLRVPLKDGKYKTTLIAAKTRVAPIKPISLPRLELCGAVLLSKLLSQVSEAMKLSRSQIYAWTDSTVVLSWLQGEPTRWQTFVRNRVVTVLDNIGCSWYHVQSQDNPADVASRGMLLPDLVDYDLWWHGPKWLKDNQIKLNKHQETTTDLERRTYINTNLKIENLETNSITEKFDHFNSLNELLSTLVICKRFLNFKKQPKLNLNITTKELDEVLLIAIKLVQGIDFVEERYSIKTQSELKRNSKLKTLNPFLDGNGILRVGGRLRHADCDEERKHPIILGPKNKLTPLIIADAHLQTLHGGVQLTISYLRSRYWIIRAKNAIKLHIRRCFICARYSAKAKTQIMGDLPKVRVTISRPFLHAGVDFAGPFNILLKKGRGGKTVKGYVAIFVCMAVKAIHLELVGDLTSEAFMGAFRRFIARRGKCSDLWSDQGRNFVGANKELMLLWKNANLEFEGHISESLAKEGTQWHFIPAYSPNFGGLWEAGVKSLKYHLKRIVTANLTFEEMTTVLCQIEACLNSRPLIPQEILDVDNIDPLTPGHFLIGEAPKLIPVPNFGCIKVSSLSRWQHTQKMLGDFWRRWQQDYLAKLQQRSKWLKKVEEFNIGDIVLIKVENLPPGKWILGRVMDKHPGSDGITRVYSVKSGEAIVKRCVSKLCPFPVKHDD